MKNLTDNLTDWADIVFQEIVADSTDYFWPKSNEHKVFEQAYMKFVNRNLNYFDYKNMIVTAVVDEPEYHPGLTKTLEFCKFVRENFDNKHSPFGRMCVWKIPPKAGILPHVDNYIYHALITRYIFIVSDHNKDDIFIKINNIEVPYKKGRLFEFYPAVERHEFTNHSNDPLYFLGFDVWKKDKLDKFSQTIDLLSVASNPKRYNSFGGINSKCKYMSKH